LLISVLQPSTAAQQYMIAFQWHFMMTYACTSSRESAAAAAAAPEIEWSQGRDGAKLHTAVAAHHAAVACWGIVQANMAAAARATPGSSSNGDTRQQCW
jgi:hypothetical protein